MARAYDVNDPDAYKANAVPFAKYGARFPAPAGRHEIPEGLRGRGRW
jgi:hypothetical protein